MNRDELMEHMENGTKVFQNKAIKEAFLAIDRKDFVGADYDFEAYEDYSLPTLNGQNMSKPTTIAFMLELLDPQPGDVILQIGSGSGFVTALLGQMVGEEGKVTGLEIDPDLVKFSQENLKKYEDLNLPVEIIQVEKPAELNEFGRVGAEVGYFKTAPYNKILVNAALQDRELVAELLVQLAEGGIMVAPVLDSLIKFEKENTTDEEYFETEYPGFSFDPYIS